MNKLSKFEEKINVVFSNKSTLEKALTHSSYARGKQIVEPDNERLEFFGDAVLKLIVSEYLFYKYP